MTHTTLPTTASARPPRSTRARRAWIVVGLLVVFMLINHADKSVIACRVILGFAEGPAFALANHAAGSPAG